MKLVDEGILINAHEIAIVITNFKIIKVGIQINGFCLLKLIYFIPI